jgi:ubiquinone/menaquinone biosynthesis C-methylase UbiE
LLSQFLRQERPHHLTGHQAVSEVFMNQSAKFWNKVAERYAKSPVSDEATYQKKLEITRDYFQPDMQVLEIGCGTGTTAIAHAPYVKHILAIDISSKMIEIAQGKADTETVRNITFQCSTVDECDVPDQSLDAVLAHNVIHLLENKEEVFNQVHKMLKPGGVFVTSTACLGNMMILFRVIAPIGKFLGLFPLVRVFTIKELEHSMINAGFEISYKWLPGKNKPVFIVARKPN